MQVSAARRGLELPACTWAVRRGDLEMTESMTTKAAVDPLISKPTSRSWRQRI